MIRSDELTITKLSSIQAGRLGEMLALAKLNTLGLAAYTSPEGAPGHDLMVVVDGKALSVEVKTRQFLRNRSEITRWPVELKTKGDADFFLFVELSLPTLAATFFLLTNEQARATHMPYKGGGNCVPSRVRNAVRENDFSILLARPAGIPLQSNKATKSVNSERPG